MILQKHTSCEPCDALDNHRRCTLEYLIANTCMEGTNIAMQSTPQEPCLKPLTKKDWERAVELRKDQGVPLIY